MSNQNRRRNNPQDMTIEEQRLMLKEIMCRDFCKYTDKKYRGSVSQQTLDEICEQDCPLSRL